MSAEWKLKNGRYHSQNGLQSRLVSLGWSEHAGGGEENQ